MRKRFFQTWIMIIALVICGAGKRDAMAYTIDGNVADWGIDLSLATSAGYLDAHLPSGGWDINYITEDNTDDSSGWVLVGPGWSYENWFDAEAIYFDNDQNYAYLAVVTGTKKEGWNVNGDLWRPGDIGIDVDGDGSFEYGIDISNDSLISGCAWNDVYYSQFAAANPWTISSGNNAGTIDFVYSDTAIQGHYVLEAAIPLSYLGLSANPGDPVQAIGLHWTMECGNDYLNLNADVNPVPEPATMLLLGTGLIGLAGLGRKRLRKV